MSPPPQEPTSRELRGDIAQEQESVLSALARRAGTGDRRALEALYGETRSLVHGWATRVLRDPGDAEEVTIDVYLQVWNGASRHDPSRGSVRGWIGMLARSRAIDRMRRRQRRGAHEEAVAELPVVASEADGPATLLAADEQRGRVGAALATLPETQRRAIVAAFYGGLSHAEVAASLGEPLGTIKTRIRRGLLALRERLDPAVLQSVGEEASSRPLPPSDPLSGAPQ